ncbi:MAG TPA: hypothetical protein VIB38_15500 [Aestuariivirgaceae bacterium]|jgi:hypothetical protein
MSSDTEAARDGERPVDPPIIDLEAEEVPRGEESKSEPPTDPPVDEGGKRQWFAPFWPATILALVAIAVAAGSLFASAGWINLRPPDRNPVLEARFSSLEARGQEIERGLAQLTNAVSQLAEAAQRPAQSRPGPEALERATQQMEARLAVLEQMIEGIGASLSAIQTSQKVQQEEFKTALQRLSEMQAQVNTLPPSTPTPQAEPKPNVRNNDVAASLLQLKAAVNEGRSFASELQKLRAILPAVERYPELAQASSTGVARDADLTDRLRSIIEEVRTPPQSQTAPSPPQNIWDAFKAKAASLVSVRKLDDAKRLDRAEDALVRAEQGDLQGAVQILGSAQAPRPPAVETWLRDAESRLEVARALEALSTAALEQLGGRS